MHILSPETDNCPSWISGRERMTVENISWSISTKECCRPRRGLNPWPPGLQSDGASDWATEAGLLCVSDFMCGIYGGALISFSSHFFGALGGFCFVIMAFPGYLHLYLCVNWKSCIYQAYLMLTSNTFFWISYQMDHRIGSLLCLWLMMM